MASKKYKFLLGLITLMTTSTFAQMGSSYSAFDSSVVTSKRMPQQNEFWNNTYNFPAKPRNMWEVGVQVGAPTISSDVSARFPTFGFGVHVRKAIGYIFSLRAQYINGVAKGLNWQAANGYAKNAAWMQAPNGNLAVGSGYNPPYRNNAGALVPFSNTINGGTAQAVFYNYKTNVQDLSLQGIITLNNIRFHKQKTGFTLYGGAGLGITAFNVSVNALDASGKPYSALFTSVLANQAANGGIQHSRRKDILKLLKDGMDNTYETAGADEFGRRPKSGKNTIKPSGTILAGVSYKLGKRINIALEDRHTFVKTDLLDGQRWQEHPAGDPALTSDFDSYNFLSLGVNFNLGAKSVEPLWWLNPLDYAYSELNNPKHMKLPKPVFDDADGDGVTDQLDREPSTPAGCPVDTHGVTKDTDGDGVPDCKDKQLITPTDCQPVDADGVGKCPEPACCAANKAAIDKIVAGGNSINGNCPTDFPSIKVKGVSFSKDAKALLATVAEKLKTNPDCKITLTAYPSASKASQNLADKKLDAVKNYLVEKLGISGDRIETNKVIDGGDADTIDIK